METMVVTQLLSIKEGQVGEHVFQYHYDPTVKQFEDE